MMASTVPEAGVWINADDWHSEWHDYRASPLPELYEPSACKSRND